MPLILPGNSGSATAATGFNVANSGRFNDGSPDILKNGTESDGNRKIWTMSMWIKRSKLGVRQTLWNWGSNSSAEGGLYIDANDFLVLNNDNQQGSSNEVAGQLLDVSAWYHIVWRCDVTESDNDDRWRCYINGVQRTLTDGATISNADGEINKNGTHQNWIGGAARSLQSGNPIYPFGGYIAEAIFVDGTALAPTSFGEFSDDGIWKPIEIDLTFGDEGVYLNFENAAELGTDVSGNGNTYAETGLTAANQSIDTCTNNFNTLNPLTKRPAANGTIAEGNLQYTAATNDSSIYGTMGITPGMKVYFEVKLVNNVAQNAIGIHNEYDRNGAFHKAGNETGGFSFKPRGAASVTQFANNGTVSNHSINNVANGTIIGVAVDNANGQIHYSIAGTYINSSDPTDNDPVALVTGHNVSKTQFLHFSLDTSGGATETINEFNFGSPSYSESGGNSDANGFGNFNQSVPSGYLALCSKNISSTNS
jgi:hypothetical protein